MSSEIINALIPLIIGLPVGLLIIRSVFKGSILFYITGLWLSSLLVIALATNLRYLYPDYFPVYISTTLGIGYASFAFT